MGGTGGKNQSAIIVMNSIRLDNLASLRRSGEASQLTLFFGKLSVWQLIGILGDGIDGPRPTTARYSEAFGRRLCDAWRLNGSKSDTNNWGRSQQGNKHGVGISPRSGRQRYPLRSRSLHSSDDPQSAQIAASEGRQENGLRNISNINKNGRSKR